MTRRFLHNLEEANPNCASRGPAQNVAVSDVATPIILQEHAPPIRRPTDTHAATHGRYLDTMTMTIIVENGVRLTAISAHVWSVENAGTGAVRRRDRSACAGESDQTRFCRHRCRGKPRYGEERDRRSEASRSVVLRFCHSNMLSERQVFGKLTSCRNGGNWAQADNRLAHKKGGAGCPTPPLLTPPKRGNYSTSNNPAAPWPPPMHIVTTTYFAPRRLPSISAWPVPRAPVMP